MRSVTFEPKAGGRVYEPQDDGTEADWADVLEWDPPRRFVLVWNPTPNRDVTPPTELEVRFASQDAGTRVDLTHRGWERLGEVAAEARTSYDNGWDLVLQRYAAEAG